MTEKGGQIQWQIQGRGQRGLGPHVFLDQTDARRAEKKVFLKPTATPPPPPPSHHYVTVWMMGPPLYLEVWIHR